MMIYIDTRREFWKASITAVKFALTTALLGLSGILLFNAIQSAQSGGPITGVKRLCAALAFCAILKCSTRR